MESWTSWWALYVHAVLHEKWPPYCLSFLMKHCALSLDFERSVHGSRCTCETALSYLYCHLYIKNSYSENVPNVCEPRAMASVQGCACECEGSSKHVGWLARSGCAVPRVLAFGGFRLYSCLHCTSIPQLHAALHTWSLCGIGMRQPKWPACKIFLSEHNSTV